MNRLLSKKKHFRLTIFLLPLLLPLPPPPHVPSGHPAGGLGPGSGQPHIFTLEPKLGRIKRRGRLRRQGARNSWAITQRLSYTIKRPTVLFFLKCDLGYLCLATLHNYDKRQLRKIASGWGWKVGILHLASCLILANTKSSFLYENFAHLVFRLGQKVQMAMKKGPVTQAIPLVEECFLKKNPAKQKGFSHLLACLKTPAKQSSWSSTEQEGPGQE